MRKATIMYLLLVCCISCNKDNEVRLTDIYGTYEYTYKYDEPQWYLIKHVIVIKEDSTYEHKMYHRNILLIDEKGLYEFNRYIPSVSFLEFTRYHRYMDEIPTKIKSSMYVIKRNLWGKTYLTFNWPFDPDGAPIRPKYKKIE
jgi:hypothetical protein